MQYVRPCTHQVESITKMIGALYATGLKIPSHISLDYSILVDVYIREDLMEQEAFQLFNRDKT